MYKNEELKDRIERINRLKELYPNIESGELDCMPAPKPYQPAPPEPHWKDRMMKTFLGGR